MSKTIIQVGLIGLAAVLSGGCNQKQVATTPPEPPTVGVIEVTEQKVNPYFEYVGKTQASETVAIRGRLTGFLEERNFAEGADILAGHNLFRIEPEQYRAQVVQAEAQLAAAKASLNKARVDLRRYKQLLKSKNIPEMKVDEAQAQVLVESAAVKQAEAALEQAQLDLTYTEISAPISGRIDVATLDVGSLVTPESGVLATINKLDPIKVGFSVSETWFLSLMKQRLADQAGASDDGEYRHVPKVRLSDGALYEHPGEFDFIDNKVDESTGTVFVRAEFPNPDKLLLPGQFVTVVIERKVAQRAVLIPQATVLTDQGGKYVLVVNDEEKIEVRRVKTGTQFGTDLAVDEGLTAGERIVYSGIQKVRPGIPVKAELVAAPGAPTESASDRSTESNQG